MAAERDDGQNTYWSEGLPYDAIQSPDDDTGGDLVFWSEGQPYDLLQPAAAPTANTTAMFMMFF